MVKYISRPIRKEEREKIHRSTMGEGTKKRKTSGD